MSPFQSGEIRWFFAGEVPAAARAWFANGGAGRREPVRVDEYLVLPGSETASLKVREGKLELKYRTAAPRPVQFGTAVAGRRDGWRKWSRVAPDQGALLALLADAEDRWCLVGKERQLRRFALDGDAVREVDPESFPDRGCGVELTAIHARLGRRGDGDGRASAERDAGTWWSLGFEAFGVDPDRALDDVERIAAVWFEQAPPFALAESNSLAYPSWLAQLT